MSIDLERRVRHRLEEGEPGARPERRAPLVEVGAVDEADLDAEARQQRLADVEAGAEERAGRDHVVAGLELGEERAVHRRHAGGGGEGVLGALERRHALLEHAHGGVAVAGVDELVGAGLR